MTQKNKFGKYECSHCGKVFDRPSEADNCRDNHNLLYVAITREDLNRLIMFIHLKQDELLSESLIKSLTKYQSLRS